MDRAGWIGVPSVGVVELRAGVGLGTRSEQSADEFGEYLGHSLEEVIAIDEDVAPVSSEIFGESRDRDRLLPTNDIGTAATAAGPVAALLTFDRHFRGIGRVGSDVP